MPTLANQIRQMIDALAVVDPAAAAEFRGSSADRMIPAAQQPGSGFPGTAHNAPPRKKPAVRSQNKPEQCPEDAGAAISSSQREFAADQSLSI